MADVKGMEAGSGRGKRAIEVLARTPGCVRVHVGAESEAVDLMAGGAAYWPGRRTLVVADLHLGKSETFRAAGAPIPDGVHAADLGRLDGMLESTGAERLLVLGDLLHAGVGLTPRLVDEVASWRRRRPLRMEVVPGNHDRSIGSIAAEWGLIVLTERWVEGCHCFCHEPGRTAGAFTWCGHLHPLVWVGSRRTGLRLPCFWLGRDFIMLPAFCTFARGVLIEPAPDDRVFAVADGDVFEV